MLPEPGAGELNRRAAVRRWQDVPAEFAIEQTFEPGLPAWVKLEPVGNAVFFGTKQVGEGVTHRITLRRHTGLTESTITAEHVVDVDGYRHRVRRASALNGGRVWVVLEVERLGLIP